MGKRTAKQRRQELKDRIFAAYGGYRCVCCGEEEPEFLCLHHANHDGKAHRADLAMQSKTLFAWILDHDFPPVLVVLCYNCHHSIHLKANRGVCAHGQRVPKGVMPACSMAKRRRILAFLGERRETSWREIRRAHRNIPTSELQSLFNILEQEGIIERETRRTRGRPRKVYRLHSNESKPILG